MSGIAQKLIALVLEKYGSSNPEEEHLMSWADRAGLSGSVCPLRDTRTTSLPHNSTTTAAT